METWPLGKRVTKSQASPEKRLVPIVVFVLHLANGINGCCSADLVSHYQQRGFSVRRCPSRNEHQSLRPKITSRAHRGVATEIAIVDILHKRRDVRVANVIDHNATNALEANERIGLAIDASDGHSLRFRTFVVTAIVKGAVFIVAPELSTDNAGSGDGSMGRRYGGGAGDVTPGLPAG